MRATYRLLTAVTLQCALILFLAVRPGVRAVELPPGFASEILATNLNAMTALAVASDGRVFLGDQTGKVLLWKNDGLLTEPVLTVHVDDYWERGLIGLALHPNFPATPHLFALYVTDRPTVHHVLSRFTVTGDKIEAASESRLLEGDDQSKLGGTVPGGHQGGALCFGNDGKLYVSIGDHTAGEPAQSLATLQGKILRLSPDGSIPEDNPFFARASGKYRATYALGLRNVFGLAVELPSDGGRMFATDVGGSAFEEVNELVAGGNYGWPRSEGYSTNTSWRSPLYAYPPVLGRSICGGTFYPRTGQGARFPEKWRGKFFFVDFMAHWLRALDPNSPTNAVMFARGLDGPIAVEVAPDGSLLVLNRGTIWRDPKKFVPNAGSLVRLRYTAAATASVPQPSKREWAALELPRDFADAPTRLSRTKLFAALQHGAQLAELRPYDLNAPRWTPGIQAQCYFALPPNRKLTPRASDDWGLPPGAVLVKHFSLLEQGRPVETRLIVAGEEHAYGVSYRWRADSSDADRTEDPELVEIGKGHHWFLAGPEEVLRFPTFDSGYVTDLNYRQLNREVPRGDGTNLSRNQIAIWRDLGLLAPPPSDAKIADAPRLRHWNDRAASPELRVRSYLDVHCAGCHQPGGPSRGNFDARFNVPLAMSGLVNGEPVAGDIGVSGAKLVLPCDLNRSILYQRLKRTDFFRMPPVQYHDQPSPILPVIAEWITSLKPSQP